MLRRYCYVLLLLLTVACNRKLYVQQETASLLRVDSTLKNDTALAGMLRYYKTGVDKQMKTIIGSTETPLIKAQPEGTLGNLVADAQLVAAQNVDNLVVASVSNYGGIRLNFLDSGVISRGKIFELMPFDNIVVIADMPGYVVRLLCNKMAVNGGWPVSSINYLIKSKNAQEILINNRPLDDSVVYKVAVSDYIANGGDNCDFLKPLKKIYTPILVRDAILDYIAGKTKQGKPLHLQIEKRVTNAE